MIRKIMAISLIGVMFSVLTSSLVGAVEDGVTFTVTRTVVPDDGKVMVGETTEITYNIQPNNIEVEQTRDAEIALVIDTSGSMSSWYGNASRLESAKQAAKQFIENFASDDHVKISIIDYNTRGYIDTELLNANDPSLITAIDNLSASGMTNIGDGIRLAYYQLANGEEDADKYMVFMTDGYANYSTFYRVDQSGTDDHSGNGGNNHNGGNNGNQGGYNASGGYNSYTYEYYFGEGSAPYVSYSGGMVYARYMAERLAVGSEINEDMYIKPYYIAFSDNASYLRSIAHVGGDLNEPRVEGTEYSDVGSGTALIALYESIAKDIEDAISKKVQFREVFDASIEVDAILDSDLTGITSDMVEVTQVDGMSVISSSDTGWPIQYTYNTELSMYTAEPIEVKVRIKASQAGLKSFGGLGSSYVSYQDEDGVTHYIDFEEKNLDVFQVNPPVINMSQSISTADKTFTLQYNGLSNMYFGGNASGEQQYADFGTTWSDEFFSGSNDSWTIRAVLRPDNLDREYSNHYVKNVFFAKASDDHNDNIEIGIDDASGNLLLYLDTDKVDKQAISVGSGELTEGSQHEVIVTYDHGLVYVSLDGNEYKITDYNVTDNQVDDAIGSSLILGGTLHSDVFYSGSISEIGLFDEPYREKDFYAGRATEVYAYWYASDSDSTTVKDSSGNGRDSQLIGGIHVQNDLASESLDLYYKLGESSPWINYSADDEITALSSVGSVEVYAKAVYRPSDSDHVYESDVVSKTATKSDNAYFKQITMASDSYDLVVDDDYTMTYTFSGDPLGVALETSSYIDLDPVYIELAYPSDVNVLDVPTGFTVDNTRHIVYGNVTGVRLVRLGSGEYQVEDVVLQITAEPKDWHDVNYPENSAEIEFTDLYGQTLSVIGGIEQSINVTPQAPIIDDVTGDNLLYQPELANVVFTGTTDPTMEVYIYVAGDDYDDLPVMLESVVGGNVISEADGTFTSDDFDLTTLKPYEVVTVYAEISDPENDTAIGLKAFNVLVQDLNFEMK